MSQRLKRCTDYKEVTQLQILSWAIDYSKDPPLKRDLSVMEYEMIYIAAVMISDFVKTLGPSILDSAITPVMQVLKKYNDNLSL